MLPKPFTVILCIFSLVLYPCLRPQDRLGSLFFMLLYLSLMSLSSLPIWRDDRLVFMRERAAGAYGTAAYFTAVVLFDFLPLRVRGWKGGGNRKAGR